jgi:fibronectin-binding autotransporter adhesin
MSTLPASCWKAVSSAALCLFVAQSTWAAITTTGNVTPDPNTTDSYDDLYVGNTADGTMLVNGGSDVLSQWGYLGRYEDVTGSVTVTGSGSTWNNGTDLYVGREGSGVLEIYDRAQVSDQTGVLGSEPGSTGVATVSGVDSRWTNSNSLFVGKSGDGTLNIRDGGRVLVTSRTWVGTSGGQGIIRFDGGRLHTGSLLAGTTQLEGTGTIFTRGLVSDVDLAFDDPDYGGEAILTLNGQPNQDITIELDLDGYHEMGAGYVGQGSLSIVSGTPVYSTYGYLGYHPGSVGTATVAGTNSAWDNSRDLYVGNHGLGTLDISSGGRVTNDYGYIARSSDSTGEVTVDGPRSTWVNLYDLCVGESGIGTLAITDGGVISDRDGRIGLNDGSMGTVTVDGLGSTWTNSNRLIVGGSSGGTLAVTRGGTVSSTYGAVGGTATVTVDGPDSSWTVNGNMFVGGRADITGGGTLSSEWSYVGSEMGAFVAVDGDDSSWTAGALYLGGDDDGDGAGRSGDLIVADRGLVSSTDGRIACVAGSRGSVTIDGNGSTWDNSGRLQIGMFGDGAMSITAGGQVTSDEALLAVREGSAVITIDGAGSRWTCNGDLRLGLSGSGKVEISDDGTADISGWLSVGGGTSGNGLIGLAGGTLRLHGGELWKGDGIAVLDFRGGRLEGAGTINLGAPLVQNGGTLAPGNSAGKTTIEGGYTLGGGALEIEIAGHGTAGANWDLVEVNGTVDLVGSNGLLDGMLNVILGFAPSLGDEFLVLDNDGTDAIVGAFATWATVKAPYDGGLYQFAIDYTAGDGNDIALVTQVVGLLGDYSGDDVVDAADYTVWRDMLGAKVAPYFGADGNGDGIVNDADHAVWKAMFGNAPQTNFATGQTTAIPEPATCMLLAVAALAAIAAARRRR